MAHAPEAPATSTTAEGPTSHTQNQAMEELLSRLERLEEQRTADESGYTRQQKLDALHKLREPFPASEIRYRPQPWCKKCSEAQGWPKVCQHHHEIKCQRCNGQKITDAHICLKFIGHAEATNRLLNVDPFWNWEPMALDGGGLPQYDGNRGMWIRLTVCGMTRIGYGDAAGKNGANAVKEIIGDAIRNAGMRFGMALDLWTSSDLEIIESGGAALEQEETSKGAEGDGVRASAQEPAASDRDAELQPFLARMRNGWSGLTATLQSLAEAEAKGYLTDVIPFNGDYLKIEDILNTRIAQLKALKGNGEQSAA